MFRIATLFVFAAFFCTQAAFAADVPGYTVTVGIDNFRTSVGQVQASLCTDPKAPFPGACTQYVVRVPAQSNGVTLTFKNVPAGNYALQVMHDANGNNRLDAGEEGWAFGNDAPFPASFDAATIKVSGDTSARVRLAYLFSNGAPPQPVVATSGVPAPAGVTKTDLRSNGLYGALYVPQHSSPLPAIIMIGGSEGGLETISGFAAGYSRKGYAVLALAYWKEPGLPQTLEDVPLEYFDRAIAWLTSQPGIDGSHIGLLGWSRGGEAALLIASRNPAIRAVVGVAPSSIVWQGLNFADLTSIKPAWTVNGKPLPFSRPSMTAYRPGQPMRSVFDASLLDADLHPETAIPVEKISGSILLLAGGDDALWPSAEFAARVATRLKANNFQRSYEVKIYEGAGHAVLLGDPASASFDITPVRSMFGGTAEADAKAQADSWARTLQFFDTALKASTK